MKKNYILLIIFSIIIIVVIIDNVKCRSKIREIESKLDHSNYIIETKEKQYNEFVEKTNKQIIAFEQKTRLISTELRTYDKQFDRIKRLGIDDPIEFIKNDLLKNQELIPNRNTSKGKMHFWKDHIYVLNHRWVIAYYEDGHFSGYINASYEIDMNKKVKWRVLDHIN